MVCHQAACASVSKRTMGAPVLHGHWCCCPMAHRGALPSLAASRPVVRSLPWLVLLVCDGAPLHLPVPVWVSGRRVPPVLHGHWRSCPMASYRGALLSLAVSCPVFGSSPFRIQDNCSRSVRWNMVLLARDSVPSSGRMCQCEQADDRSRLCSMATGAWISKLKTALVKQLVTASGKPSWATWKLGSDTNIFALMATRTSATGLLIEVQTRWRIQESAPTIWWRWFMSRNSVTKEALQLTKAGLETLGAL